VTARRTREAALRAALVMLAAFAGAAAAAPAGDEVPLVVAIF
jgi:hypothetical protein